MQDRAVSQPERIWGEHSSAIRRADESRRRFAGQESTDQAQEGRFSRSRWCLQPNDTTARTRADWVQNPGHALQGCWIVALSCIGEIITAVEVTLEDIASDPLAE